MRKKHKKGIWSTNLSINVALTIEKCWFLPYIISPSAQNRPFSPRISPSQKRILQPTQILHKRRDNHRESFKRKSSLLS